jgi:hypothetical protein
MASKVTRQQIRRNTFSREFTAVNRQFGVGEYSSTIPRRARRKIARNRAKAAL